MKVQTYEVSGKKCNTCRGGSGSTSLILDGPISQVLLDKIVATGQYAENTAMTKAGILYVESKALTINGAFGRKQLSIKCKFSIFGKVEECKQAIDTITDLIKSIE